MEEDESDKNFKFATSLIKIITLVIALMALVISRYAFIFFIAAMLPTILAIFIDKNSHKCLSATLCTFNLIGVLPYLMKMWNSSSIDYVSKQILADVNTWMVIYGAAFIGQLLYISIPLLILRIYTTKVHMQVMKYRKEQQELCTKWNVDMHK